MFVQTFLYDKINENILIFSFVTDVKKRLFTLNVTFIY